MLSDVAVDPDRLTAYDRVCGFALRDALPATYPHILAFPLQLSLMTDPSFPFPAIGLVHIYNRIIQHRPIRTSERLRVTVWATPLEDHPRGKQFSLLTEVAGRRRARLGGGLDQPEARKRVRRRRGQGARRGAPAGRGPAGDARPGRWPATWAAATARCPAT